PELRERLRVVLPEYPHERLPPSAHPTAGSTPAERPQNTLNARPRSLPRPRRRMRVARDGRLRPLDSVRGATSWPARSAAPQRSTRRTSTGRCPPPGRTETPQPRPAGAPPGPPALARRRLATARSGPARDADRTAPSQVVVACISRSASPAPSDVARAAR